MGSRRQTAGKGARLPELSRRSVIAGASAAVLPSPRTAVALPAAATIDDSAKPYRRWLHLNGKIERLQTRWAKLETWLVREHRWFELIPAEQQALPWAQELRDIDGCLDLLFEQREALLESLPPQGAATLQAVAAKLAVVERLVEHDDHPEAHAMIGAAGPPGLDGAVLGAARRLDLREGRLDDVHVVAVWQGVEIVEPEVDDDVRHDRLEGGVVRQDGGRAGQGIAAVAAIVEPVAHGLDHPPHCRGPRCPCRKCRTGSGRSGGRRRRAPGCGA
jgi:hypothetical protein